MILSQAATCCSGDSCDADCIYLSRILHRQHEDVFQYSNCSGPMEVDVAVHSLLYRGDKAATRATA